MKHTKLILGAVVLLAAAVFYFSQSINQGSDTAQQVSADDPVDIATDFYDSWLSERTSSDTDPYTSGLVDDPLLGKALRTRLADTAETATIDPVLCQTTVPTRITSRRVLEQDNTVQILILSKEPPLPGQATLTLRSLNDGWYIEDIHCSQGESAPEREYTFEAEGLLLKDLEPIVIPGQWHLAFTRDEVRVQAVPLLFSADSICVGVEGQERVCDPAQLTDTKKVFLQGGMTEAGVEVKRITDK